MKKNQLCSHLLRETGVGKLMLVMRIALSIMLLTSFAVTANTAVMSQQINLQVRDAELREVLRLLKEESGYMITYSENQIAGNTSRVTADLKNVSLEHALDVVLKDLPYSYKITDRTVLIIQAPAKQSPGQVTIIGRVTDSAGRPLVGAAIVVPGTGWGASSDADGQFNLTVPYSEGMVLRATYLGKQSVDIFYAGQTDISIVMEDFSSEISEVVVTGYQTIAREKVTGSTTTVTADELSSRYTPDILTNLEGRVAGLMTYGGKTTIRGTGSLFAETSPLLVVDGLPMEGNLSDINPYDVESITVLKDAAAAAIYGARAANGIIVITTKRARDAGRVSVDVSANFTVYEKRNLDYSDNFYMTPAQHVAVESEYLKYYFSAENDKVADPIASTESTLAASGKITPIHYAYYQLATNAISQDGLNDLLEEYSRNNFAKEYSEHAMRNRLLQQYNVAVRSRSDNFQSNLVANFRRDNNGIKHAYDNQLNISFRGFYDMSKWLSINFGVTGILSKSKESNSQYATDPFNVPSYYRLFNEDGSLAYYSPETFYGDYATQADEESGLRSMHFNHLEELAYDQTATDRQNMRYQGELVFRIIEGLSANTQFVYEADRSNSSSYSEADSYATRYMRNVYTLKEGGAYTYLIPENGGKLATTDIRGDYWTARGQINFNRTFHSRHTVDLLAGLEFRQTKSKGTRGLLFGYDEQLQTHATTTVNIPGLYDYNPTQFFMPGYQARSLMYYNQIAPFIGPVIEEWHRYASGYLNATYTYDNRYNLFVSFRKDYADLLGANTKYRGKPLWSVGASWNISREDFMQGIDWMDQLKLRVSYGVTGNIYQGANSYLTATTSGLNPYSQQPVATVSSPANSELTWEKTATTNIGVDFSLFGNRLHGSVDWYSKKGTDLFSYKSLETTKGFTRVNMNIADMKNTGVELALSYDWLRSSFFWSTSLTAAFNKNRVTDVEVQTPTAGSLVDLGYKVGYPVGSLFSYRFAGLNDIGRPTWYDAEGGVFDKISDVSPDAVVYSGVSIPKVSMAMENRVAWRGVSLSVMMVYYGGHKMRVRQAFETIGIPFNVVPSYFLNAWTPDNPDTNIPGIGRYTNTGTAASASEVASTDIYVQPADFVKIRNIVVGYDLPEKLLTKIGMNNVSLRFQIDNPKPLWVKNNVDIDPETHSLRRQTSYIFGINFNF